MKLPAFLRTFSTLQLALGVSIAVHAALISVRFIDPEGFNRVFQDTPLEVILVNAKSNERPDKAQAIAQANLAGGGDAEKGRVAAFWCGRTTFRWSSPCWVRKTCRAARA